MNNRISQIAKKVLIIDDDKEFLEELNSALRSSGYDVESLDNPENAVSEAARMQPDVIIMDLKMPKTSGFEVACQLRYRAETSRIPVIAMSSYYYPDEHPWFKSFCSFKRWLTKPFDPSEIVDEIESVLVKRE